MTISLLDWMLIALMLTFGALVMIRGFSREILSLASLLAATAAALFLHERLSPLLASFTSPVASCTGVSSVVAAGLIFFVTLAAATLISIRINNHFSGGHEGGRTGRLDRTLGFVFGAMRGLLLAAGGLLFYTIVVPINQPGWIANAKSKPVLDLIGAGFEQLVSSAPGSILAEKIAPLMTLNNECWVQLAPGDLERSSIERNARYSGSGSHA